MFPPLPRQVDVDGTVTRRPCVQTAEPQTGGVEESGLSIPTNQERLLLTLCAQRIKQLLSYVGVYLCAG